MGSLASGSHCVQSVEGEGGGNEQKMRGQVNSEFRISVFLAIFPTVSQGLTASLHREPWFLLPFASFSESPRAVSSLKLLQHSLLDDFKLCWDPY